MHHCAVDCNNETMKSIRSGISILVYEDASPKNQGKKGFRNQF